jgi:hypothetical protein
VIGGSLSQRFGTAKTFLMAGCADICVLALFIVYWFAHPTATKLEEEI